MELLAREMFEELGYTYKEAEVEAGKEIIYTITEGTGNGYFGHDIKIIFMLFNKKFAILGHDNDTYKDEFVAIGNNELRAINKQFNELGWTEPEVFNGRG